ncbi:uncharacterized protein LOC132544368 [Ylistrum balloti]|uniref:uncharacterized protein LOC132544368 n=1 Tax=Ylistrum balloti TaxID=509963 RepID=UPI002905B404|nr:uncharacterized protein LOC132544368 [Ylistrum balloti]
MKELCSLDTSLRDIILAVPMEDYQSACSITESSGLQRSRGRNPIQLLVLKGDITKEQADVIVNTTSKCLDLSSGTVSNSLSQRAGPKLQKECRKKYANGIKFGELAVTDGHQLLCRKVFHGAFDVWPSLDKNQTKKTEMVGKFVTKCLERANELGMNSISFPAIGTGNLNYPSSVVAKEMLQKIKCFMVESNPSHLKKISIVVYPRDTQTFANFTEEEKSIMVGESSVDPWPKTQPVNIREQTTPQHRVYFRVTCSAADKMILVSKIDNILRDDVRKPDHDKVDNGTGDLEPVQKTRPETRRSGRGEISLQDEQEDIAEAMDMTLKASRSDSGVTHYIKPTSVMESCVVIQSQHTRTDVRNWLERDLGVRPFGIAWPYRNKVNEVLVTCKSKTDAEKVLREKNADFQTATMEQQGLFNVHAFMDPKFLPYKCEIQENSGATVEVDMSGMCQLVGNFPQIEAANEFINSMDMRQKKGSVKINLPSEEGYVDGINVDVYNAFSVFLQTNPSYKHYQKGLKSMRYSEVDTTLYFSGSKEFCLDFKKKLTQMKCDTVCVQIDVEGRHFKMGSVKEILRTLSDSQYDVYISIPQEETMKVINLIGLDRNKVQTMKYKVLESIGMANSRRTRNFDCGFSSFRTKEPILVLPPPPSARLYHLGDNMEVLVYSGDILGLKVDGIVNAANEHLDHGGGVANAISNAANIQRESTEYVRKNGKVKVGTSCHTSAGNLKHYKYIIHAVGPHWDSKKQSECEQKLQDAVMSSILEADVLELESVAIPAISAGIFSMPPALCVVQYRLGLKRAWSKLQQKTQHFVKEVHFVDKNAVIVQEIENEFDSLLESANLNPQQLTGHQPNLPTRQISGHNVPSTPFIDEGNDDFTTKGARPKAKPLYPYREFSNRRGIDEETFHLTSETRVHVYTCDILATRVDAIVCGQDKQLHSNSRIATRIKEGELSGVKFSMEMSKIKKNYKKKYGEMFHVPITGFDAGILLMVICPSLSTDSLSKCKKEIHSCALNVFTKATELGLRSIALPVLGTGSDINKARNIAKVIMESILKFAQTSQPTNSLKDIHFVNHDPNVTKAIVEMFEGHVKAGKACIQTSFKPKVFPGSAQRLVQSLHQLKQDCLDDYHRSAWKSDDHHQFERTPSFVHQNEQQTHLEESDMFKMTDDKSQSDADIIKEKPRIYEDCVICMDTVTSDNVKTLPKCNHSFHPECIDAQFTHKPVCPTCGAIYGVIIGNQPRNGKMNTEVRKGSLPGFEGDKQFIYILYSFPDGIQENDHPNPGVRYKGTSRGAYLPDNPKGRAVLAMLKIAFKRRLTFTIGHSRTTGEENVVTWNDIHHKTNKTGGQQQYGYPDPEYLERVSEELAVKGVTEADIQKEQ